MAAREKTVFGKLLELFGGGNKATPRTEAPSDFERLNEVAPLKAKASDAGTDRRSFVCREAILDRQEKIAGYEFSLSERLQSRLNEAAARCRLDAGQVTGAALEALGWTREITSMQDER